MYHSLQNSEITQRGNFYKVVSGLYTFAFESSWSRGPRSTKAGSFVGEGYILLFYFAAVVDRASAESGTEPIWYRQKYLCVESALAPLN